MDTFSHGSPIRTAAAHPAEPFGAGTAMLLSEAAGTGVLCLNPEEVTLEQMVDDIEACRQKAGIGRWVFWGMSGGGWLAQLYAHRQPQALAGIIIESSSLCFREWVADPACPMSPFFPAWGDALRARGLLVAGSHDQPSPGEDTEWEEVPGVGKVFRRRAGPALLVSPMTVKPYLERAMPRLWTFDSRSWIGSLKIPSLVIAGALDPVVPLHRVRAVHEALPGSEFVQVEGGGHVPVSERRPRVAEAVRAFLARVFRG